MMNETVPLPQISPASQYAASEVMPMNDGTTRKIESHADLLDGAVVRMLNEDGTAAPFSDAVVLGPSGYESATMAPGFKLARPYVFASSTGTTCPTPLQGCEVFEVLVDRLQRHFVLVLDSKGRPFTFKT
jgi:hypothetical protein